MGLKAGFIGLGHMETGIEVLRYIDRCAREKGLGEMDRMQFILDFVQKPNIAYEYDEKCDEIGNLGEYARYPDETLFDGRGGVKRPDRVLVADDGTVTVIDYKFGEREAAYDRQVAEYVRILRSMGYPNVSGHLWYLSEK